MEIQGKQPPRRAKPKTRKISLYRALAPKLDEEEEDAPKLNRRLPRLSN